MKKIFYTFILSLMIFPVVSLAHPGRTDSSGCHTCRTNCSKWGLGSGEYHCHRSKGVAQPLEPIKSTFSENGGSTAPAPEYKTPAVTPKPISAPVVEKAIVVPVIEEAIKKPIPVVKEVIEPKIIEKKIEFEPLVEEISPDVNVIEKKKEEVIKQEIPEVSQIVEKPQPKQEKKISWFKRFFRFIF